MKVRYKGPTFGGGFLGLTDGKTYECVGVEYDLLRIIDDEGPVAAGIVHPGSQSIPVQHRARGIVGIAQVDHIHVRLRQGRHEAVLRVAGQVDQPIPLTV